MLEKKVVNVVVMFKKLVNRKDFPAGYIIFLMPVTESIDNISFGWYTYKHRVSAYFVLCWIFLLNKTKPSARKLGITTFIIDDTEK